MLLLQSMSVQRFLTEVPPENCLSSELLKNVLEFFLLSEYCSDVIIIIKWMHYKVISD